MADKEYQVNCIRKPDRFSPHEHITHIGNTSQQWLLTRESAITRIDGGHEAYFTIDATSGRRMYIAVIRETEKHPYLRTHADGKYNDNLLAQPFCGADCRLIS
jgi:hypothetical protein